MVQGSAVKYKIIAMITVPFHPNKTIIGRRAHGYYRGRMKLISFIDLLTSLSPFIVFPLPGLSLSNLISCAKRDEPISKSFVQNNFGFNIQKQRRLMRLTAYLVQCYDYNSWSTTTIRSAQLNQGWFYYSFPGISRKKK